MSSWHNYTNCGFKHSFNFYYPFVHCSQSWLILNFLHISLKSDHYYHKSHTKMGFAGLYLLGRRLVHTQRPKLCHHANYAAKAKTLSTLIIHEDFFTTLLDISPCYLGLLYTIWFNKVYKASHIFSKTWPTTVKSNKIVVAWSRALIKSIN